MTHDEADQLANLITRTWRTSPSADIWADELRGMRWNQADATYRQLRRHAEHAPTIAQFWATYRAHAQEDASPAGCNDCDGHGWLSVVEPHNGHDYQCSTPCRCPAGKANEHTHRTVTAHNVAELDRLSLNERGAA